jgi:hypothetical protein
MLFACLGAATSTHASHDMYIFRGGTQSIHRVQNIDSMTFRATVPEGLLAYYPVRAVTSPQDVLVDLSGNGKDGSLATPDTRGLDRFRLHGSLYPNRFPTGNPVTLPLSISNLTECTIALWIRPMRTGDEDITMSVLKTEGTANFTISLTGSKLSYGLTTSDPDLNRWDGEGLENAVAFNQWNMIVFRYEDGAVHTFVNGESDARGTSAKGPIWAPGSLMLLGWKNGNAQFEGGVDDIRIYSRSLSAVELRTLYYEGDYEPD